MSVVIENSSAQAALDIDSREELALELPRALANHEFKPYFQPQFTVQDKSLVGAEVLIRWQHPKRGVLVPAQFLSLIEGHNLMADISLDIIWQACDFLQKLQKNIKISVNVPPQLFQHVVFWDKLKLILERYHSIVVNLAIEITESADFHQSDHVNHVFEYLAAKKIDLIIDDFGSGYASLARLSQLPVRCVKIDKFFIDGILVDSKKTTIVNTMINLCHKLKLKVIAEGVETEAQLEFLREFNCDMIQGYLWGKPMVAEKILMLLRA